MFRPLATSVVALVLGAAPVFAEVTPAQVWDNISKYYADMGYDVATGTRDEAGDTLTLTDITLTLTSGSADVAITIPAMTLQRTGDAKVRSVIDGDITAGMTSDMPEDAEDLAMQMVLSAPGNEMISSGSAEDMLHEISYPMTTMTLRFDAEDAAEPSAEAPVRIAVSDLAGSYRSKTGSGTEALYDMTAKTLDLSMNLPDTTEADDSTRTGSATASATVDGLTMTGNMTTPEGQVNMSERPHEALRAGLVLQGKMVMGAITGNAEFQGTDAEGGTQSGGLSFSSDSSELSFGMAQDGMTYTGSATGAKAEMTTSDLPFPVSYAVASASGSVAIPISKSDQPQPYKLTYALAGLTFADAIWDMFDPQGQLPRDPASLLLDLEGLAMVSDDLMDPAFADRMAQAAADQDLGADDGMGDSTDGAAQGQTGDVAADDVPEMPVPFRPQTVTINQFTLDAVGAKADVTGDLTIPEDAQQPVGTLEGDFTGINALLDTLVAMGIVPQEQVMGARMMIAMFARPADNDPDALQTRLEFREDGSIFANGQQVK